MVLRTEPRTRAELLALPDDGCRHELIDGEHIVTPAPGVPHQRVLMQLIAALRPHVQAHALGELFTSPADLALGEDEVLQPDLFVISADVPRVHRWEDVTSLLLVVEVVSPSSGRIDRHRKRLRYQRAGVSHYWVVDPEQQRVEVWHPTSAVGEIWEERLVWAEPAGAPLEIDLRAVFNA